MMPRLAVIDLGTNTFHLLILGFVNGNLVEVYRERQQVYLADEGIATIGEGAYGRALNALKDFREKINEYQAERVKAIATAAFRKASNSAQLRAEILNETGIEIEVISGDREASLIFKGASLAIPLDINKSYLIMDIGGGSVEFILVEKKKPSWSKSFPIGVAILHQLFHRIDPIPESEVIKMESYLEDVLEELAEQIGNKSIEALIGASGSFEVMEAMISEKSEYSLYAALDIAHFYPLCKLIISLNLDGRLKLENLPPNRANLVVTALILMRFIVKLSRTKKILVSKYAMKEGLAREILNF